MQFWIEKHWNSLGIQLKTRKKREQNKKQKTKCKKEICTIKNSNEFIINFMYCIVIMTLAYCFAYNRDHIVAEKKRKKRKK